MELRLRLAVAWQGRRTASDGRTAFELFTPSSVTYLCRQLVRKHDTQTVDEATKLSDERAIFIQICDESRILSAHPCSFDRERLLFGSGEVGRCQDPDLLAIHAAARAHDVSHGLACCKPSSSGLPCYQGARSSCAFRGSLFVFTLYTAY